MNKLFTKIAALSVGLMMAIGVGVAVGSNRGAVKAEAAVNTYTKVDSLAAGKDVLIVSHDTSGQYYLIDAVTAATSAGPKYITCSLSNGTISGDYDSHLFTVAASSTNWKFSTGTKYLKWSGTSSNTAIRINTGDSDNTWTYSNGTMKFSSATRYLGVYVNGTDWRSYNSSGAANYSGTGANIEFYEKSTPAVTVTGITKKTAPTKTQYVSGESFDPAGLVITVSYSSGDPEDIAYTGNETDFDWSPKTITAAGDVEIQYLTYSTMKVTQAVTLVTVVNVTGVASHPSEVSVDGTIDPNDVTLNVTYSNSTNGTVKATSVTCDTSVAANGVTATATYSPASGTKTATFTINVVVVPGYDLVTSAGSLRNGAQLIIYSYAKQKIMGNTAASSLRTGVSLSVAEEDVAFIPTANVPASAEIITLVQSGSHWELKTSGNKYLSLTSDANAQNISDDVDTVNNTTEWDISFSGNNALIQSVAYSARYIEANSSSGNFGCYKGTQSKVQLYVLRNTDPYFSINMTSMYLGPLGTQTLTITAHNNASDTVSWSTSDASVASIPNNSTSMSVVVTGVAEGTATITATFGHPATYDALVCSVEVLNLEPYVNVGVTTFTKTTTKPAGGWAGTYLIGDSTGKTVLDGSLSPLPGGGVNYASLASLPDSVSATSEMIAKSFTIKATATEGVYTIRSNSYYYIGNSTDKNGMDTSIGQSYDVSISDSGVMTMNGTTLAYNTGVTYRFFQNLSDNIRAATLWRADGEMREITNTLTSWYDAAKSENLLVCNSSGTGSLIDFDGLEDKAIELLTSNDLDTLKKMAAKSSENGGNYLEDLISDYDYIIQFLFKSADNDFLGRFASGGANADVILGKVSPVTVNSNDVAGTSAAIVVVSLISVAAFGGYFFIRRRRGI